LAKASLMLCFSTGLAITMVAAGVVAALGVKHVAGVVQSHSSPVLTAKLPDQGIGGSTIPFARSFSSRSDGL